MDTEAISKNLKGAADGLSLMILFTLLWTIIAIVFSETWYYRVFEAILILSVTVFVFYYYSFNKTAKLYHSNIKVEQTPEEKKKDNLFFIIFLTEGLAILIARNVLVNINLPQYFFPAMAFIVGVHFYPLAKLFKKKLHIYVGTWIVFISITGILVTCFLNSRENDVSAFIGAGCAAGTAIMGIYMISNGRKYIQNLGCKTI